MSRQTGHSLLRHGRWPCRRSLGAAEALYRARHRCEEHEKTGWTARWLPWGEASRTSLPMATWAESVTLSRGSASICGDISRGRQSLRHSGSPVWGHRPRLATLGTAAARARTRRRPLSRGVPAHLRSCTPGSKSGQEAHPRSPRQTSPSAVRARRLTVWVWAGWPEIRAQIGHGAGSGINGGGPT